MSLSRDIGGTFIENVARIWVMDAKVTHTLLYFHATSGICFYIPMMYGYVVAKWIVFGLLLLFFIYAIILFSISKYVQFSDYTSLSHLVR